MIYIDKEIDRAVGISCQPVGLSRADDPYFEMLDVIEWKSRVTILLLHHLPAHFYTLDGYLVWKVVI